VVQHTGPCHRAPSAPISSRTMAPSLEAALP
jgi:hypothetical protein